MSADGFWRQRQTAGRSGIPEQLSNGTCWFWRPYLPVWEEANCWTVLGGMLILKVWRSRYALRRIQQRLGSGMSKMSTAEHCLWLKIWSVFLFIIRINSPKATPMFLYLWRGMTTYKNCVSKESGSLDIPDWMLWSADSGSADPYRGASHRTLNTSANLGSFISNCN